MLLLDAGRQTRRFVVGIFCASLGFLQVVFRDDCNLSAFNYCLLEDLKGSHNSRRRVSHRNSLAWCDQQCPESKKIQNALRAWLIPLPVAQ